MRTDPLYWCKGEIVYIKSDDDGEKVGWKLDEDNKELKETLQKIVSSTAKFEKMTDEHPNWEKDPNLQKEYMKLVKNATDNLKENKREEKVIKKLCNNSYLNDKE